MAGSEGRKLIPKRYYAVFKSFGLYWKAYGGFREVYCSLYFHVSFVLLVLMFPIWSQPNWWDTVISVLPNLIGFSIGGFAIWMSFGDESFKSRLSGQRNKSKSAVSPFMGVNSLFVHFILLQVAALLWAIISKAWFILPSELKPPFIKLKQPLELVISRFDIEICRAIIWGAGFWIFLYSLLAAIAATLSILRAASWYDHFQTKKAKETHGQSKERNGDNQEN